MATVAVLVPDEVQASPREEARDAYLIHDGGPRTGGGTSGVNGTAERAVYRPSRANPAAMLASVAMILGMGACLATLNIVSAHKQRARLTAVDLRDLDVTPPPPPEPTRLETPQAAVSHTVAPRPMIELPGPGPQQVMIDAPLPPPEAPAVVSVGAKVTAPAVVAPPPAATPVEGGDLASKVISAKPPAYPIDARRAHEQGVVKLLLLVGTDGLVKDIQVASSSGSARLDGAALRAVRHWRWQPTMSNGTAMAVRGYVTIPFVLTGKA